MWEGNAFSRACHSVCVFFWGRLSPVTIAHDPLEHLTQEPPRHVQSLTYMNKILPPPQTCTNLFILKHVRLESERLASFWNTFLLLVTARKRSLGQGNVFTSVCQEFCPGGRWGEERCTLPWEDPSRIPRDTVNKRAVLILLECILVLV